MVSFQLHPVHNWDQDCKQEQKYELQTHLTIELGWWPYHIGCEWVTLMINASVVWPDSVRPLLSTMVPETLGETFVIYTREILYSWNFCWTKILPYPPTHYRIFCRIKFHLCSKDYHRFYVIINTEPKVHGIKISPMRTGDKKKKLIQVKFSCYMAVSIDQKNFLSFKNIAMFLSDRTFQLVSLLQLSYNWEKGNSWLKHTT